MKLLMEVDTFISQSGIPRSGEEKGRAGHTDVAALLGSPPRTSDSMFGFTPGSLLPQTIHSSFLGWLMEGPREPHEC